MVNTSLIESSTKLVEILTELIDTVPTASNAFICADSTCTAGIAATNLYCAPNPVSKVCFAASCVCGTIGAAASGTALITSYMGLSHVGFAGTMGARAFNRVGKYALHMGSITNGTATIPLTNGREIF